MVITVDNWALKSPSPVFKKIVSEFYSATDRKTNKLYPSWLT